MYVLYNIACVKWETYLFSAVRSTSDINRNVMELGIYNHEPHLHLLHLLIESGST